MPRDLAVTSIYTWANSKDDKSAAAGVGRERQRLSRATWTTTIPKLDYGPSDFDVDHRFVASYVYQLPSAAARRLPAESTVSPIWQLAAGRLLASPPSKPDSPTGPANDIDGIAGHPVPRANLTCGLQDPWQPDAKFYAST